VESVLPGEVRRLPAELAQVDALLDDPAFFALLEPFFDPRMGRPTTPMETYLRLMFLMFRYRLGYQSLCREVPDSITWRTAAASTPPKASASGSGTAYGPTIWSRSAPSPHKD
jgi:IS5 family transposase